MIKNSSLLSSIPYGKPIIMVRLPDGRPDVVLRENLQNDSNAQVQRVQRSGAMAEDLVFTRVETPGGVQRMGLRWSCSLSPTGLPSSLLYQREAVDVLYAWAAAPGVIEASSKKLMPSEPIVEPTRPAADASLAEWHEYLERVSYVASTRVISL